MPKHLLTYNFSYLLHSFTYFFCLYPSKMKRKITDKEKKINLEENKAN